ncbi:hypothetical protein PEBR_37781 [Penicillium brasilianum]|uniref:Cyanovirin-N domain-containing protein n=1 Tax=Penicillium brasilianum TaxID=104259 RepID=A0A1S9RBE8_PENBI|nr:hypothetical protein PEBR_37781 [Penicillium brasilianum]
MSFKPDQVHLIAIENNRDLVATLKDEELGLRIDRVNLNKCLGYHDRALKWDSRGFSEYCQILDFRWDGEVPTIHAVMRRRQDDLDENKNPRDGDPYDMIFLNLAERISIKNGRFEVQSDQSKFTFDTDATEISLKDKHILCAVLKDDDGREQYSTLDLDEYVGNDNGRLIWGGKNFSKSTEMAELEGGGTILFAALYYQYRHRLERYTQTNSLRLAERIINNNGQLEFR